MKKKKVKKSAPKEVVKQSPKSPDTEQEKPFDFGGIPNRDLKKNLGCG